jgi:hypothetical protein
MTSSPLRLAESTAPEEAFARELIASGRDDGPGDPSSLNESVLAAVDAARLASSAAAGTFGLSSAVKWIATVSVGVGVGVGALGYFSLGGNTAESRPTLAAPPLASSIAAVAPASPESLESPVPLASSVTDDAAPVATRVPSAPARPHANAARRPQPSLEAELEHLRVARSDMVAGDPEAALGRLERYRREVRDGALAPEAEAMTIDALARAGRRQEALQRAERFLQRHAGSPQATRVRRLKNQLSRSAE